MPRRQAHRPHLHGSPPLIAQPGSTIISIRTLATFAAFPGPLAGGLATLLRRPGRALGLLALALAQGLTLAATAAPDSPDPLSADPLSADPLSAAPLSTDPFALAPPEGALPCPEVDLFFDADEQVSEKRTDSNGDCRVDQVVHYAAGLPLRGEQDRDHDGRMDAWLHYGADGALIREERDRTGDGRADTWTEIAGTKPTERREDHNADGQADGFLGILAIPRKKH